MFTNCLICPLAFLLGEHVRVLGSRIPQTSAGTFDASFEQGQGSIRISLRVFPRAIDSYPSFCSRRDALRIEPRGVGPSPDLLDALAARIESPEALISWTELGRAMAFVVVTVVRLAWWSALKFALCNVLACGGYRVLGYVLPFLRFFSQIPW